MGSSQRRRAAKRERKQHDAVVTVTEVPERRDVTVIAGVATASGVTVPEEDKD